MTPKDGETAPPAVSLSVVIPFHRDEAHVEEAVVSALAQPIADLEVIVVNDDPGPESEAILAALAVRHGVRIVTHAQNRGLAAARNSGIDAATKTHLAFLDADDVFIPGATARNLAFAAACGSDVTHAPTLWTPVEALHPRPLGRDYRLFGRKIVNAALADAPAAQYIHSSWASIYRRDFLVETAVRFDETQRRFEDRLFVLDAVFAARTISFSDEAARIWRRRRGSITTGERAAADISMQADLIVKCVARAKRHAGAAGDRSLVLQRELHHSICRVIWDLRILEHHPAQSPELDEARRRLSAAFEGRRLDRRVFADPPTMIISNLEKRTGPYEAVTRRMLLNAFDMVANGDWAALFAWRRAQRRPDRIRRIGGAPPGSQELILHIGLHGAGAGAFRQTLARDRTRLAQQGVFLPETASEGAELAAALKADDDEIFGRLRREIAASGSERVLISAPDLSFPFETAADRKALLARAEAAFAFLPRRRVIAAYQRPDDYADHCYREQVLRATGWARRTGEQFAAELGPQLTDMRFLAGDWAAFADGAINLFECDGAGGFGRGVYERLNLAPPEGGETQPPSPSAEQILAARMIATARRPAAETALALSAFLAATAHLPRDPAFKLFSTKTRLALIDGFAARSLDFLGAHGEAPPVETWRRDVERAGGGAAAIHPGYIDAAIAVLANSAQGPFEPERPSAHLRLYRIGKRALSRFW